MYNRIMVPVDLAHADVMRKAIGTAAEIAKSHGSALTFVGVTGSSPGSVAHNPEEYAARLRDFADRAGAEHGVEIAADALVRHDPAVDLEKALVEEAKRIDADLVVMATHQPRGMAFLFGSNAGYVANHAPMSVMLVRGTL
jgi:nucleotide-binding universal stress UspA family protein